MDYLFWCLTFWVLCRFWILIRWIAGRFPPILEALFILGSSFFMLCNPICQVLGLFPVLWRPLVPICPQTLVWPQTHSPLPDPHLNNGHEVRRLWRTPKASGGFTSLRSTRPTLDHLPTLPDPTLDICNKLRYMKHYNLLNTLQSGIFFLFWPRNTKLSAWRLNFPGLNALWLPPLHNTKHPERTRLPNPSTLQTENSVTGWQRRKTQYSTWKVQVMFAFLKLGLPGEKAHCVLPRWGRLTLHSAVGTLLTGQLSSPDDVSVQMVCFPWYSKLYYLCLTDCACV